MAGISTWGRREIAQRIAFVEQQVAPHGGPGRCTGPDPAPQRVGRGTRRDTGRDTVAVDRALDASGLAGLAHRRWHSLSGGERQRAQIARARAQEPSELLLDEPTNHLDIAHQFDLLGLVHQLPVTSVLALHDLNLAAAFCDQLLVLSAGTVVASGPSAKVLTEALVHRVYGIRCEVTQVDPHGQPHVRFLRETPTGRGHGCVSSC